ncbi:hypothetical protein GMST_35700 [Geomonas silvestris]|uniref:Uncharacterized protein n=1 Tax=Geomonas silvestris TaxID=2740184 RepID=A0A6V8MMI3_9BACT|nr:hypothetical protein [Geomonas silvestris]GFO61245.1 hypothetical protein GMST_35700 [Geomonas silvestris]
MKCLLDGGAYDLMYGIVVAFLFVSSSLGATRSFPAGFTPVDRSSTVYKKLESWCRLDYKKDNGRDMPSNEISSVAKVKLSDKKNTYFVTMRSLSGSIGEGGVLLLEDGAAFKIIYGGTGFEVSNTITNGFKDLVETSSGGINNNSETRYKFTNGKYEQGASKEYGYNDVLDEDLSKFKAQWRRDVVTFKGEGNGRNYDNGTITGKIIKILPWSSSKQFNILIIEDADKKLIAMLIPDLLIQDVTKRIQAYKSVIFDFAWKATGKPKNDPFYIPQPRNVVMLVKKVAVNRESEGNVNQAMGGVKKSYDPYSVPDTSGITEKIKHPNNKARYPYTDKEMTSFIRKARYTDDRYYKYSNIKITILEKGDIDNSGYKIEVREYYKKQDSDDYRKGVFKINDKIVYYRVQKGRFGKIIMNGDGVNLHEQPD